MKELFTLFLIFIAFHANGLADENPIQCTDNILEQIYANQNACVLEESIPYKL